VSSTRSSTRASHSSAPAPSAPAALQARRPPPWLGSALLAACAATAALAAAPAHAALATYRWQPDISGTYSGFKTSKASSSYSNSYWGCGTVTTGVKDRVVSAFSTAAFPAACNTAADPTALETAVSGPFEFLFTVRSSTYASNTLVTGQATGTRIAVTNGSKAATLRVTLGYAKDSYSRGYFYPWGYVEIDVAAGFAGVIQPDLARIAGIAPAGTSLALQVALSENPKGNKFKLWVGNSRAAGDNSGTFVVDENTTVGTLTVGPGAGEVNTTVAPGSGAVNLDSFTLQTSAGTSPVFSVTMAFDANTAEALSLVEITNDAGNTVYGSITNPALDVIDVPLSTAITATTTLTQYRVRVTPRTDANLPSVKNWVVRGVVQDVYSPVPEAFSDGDSARVIVDRTPPPAPTGLAGAAANGTVTLSWTNPLLNDLAQVVVLRGATADFLSGAPAWNQAFTPGAAALGGTVACVVGVVASCTDTVANGTYHYRAFARDQYGNWSAASAGAISSPGPTTTISNGSTPAPDVAALCPSGARTFAGSFAAQAGGASADTITGLTVRLAAGTTAALKSLVLTDASDQLIATATPPIDGDDWTFTGLSLSAPTASAAQYRIHLVPLQHPTMPAVPGASHQVTARVVGATHALATNLAITDTGEATITVDNLSSGKVTSLAASSPGAGQMDLTWANPGSDFGNYVMVLRGTSALHVVPVEGTTAYAAGTMFSSAAKIVCSGNITSCADSGLAEGTTYYYRVFTRDACGNWSSPADVTGGPSAQPPSVTVTGVASPATTFARGGAPALVGKVTLAASAAGDAYLTSLSIANAAATAPAQADADVATVVVSNDATGHVYGVATWNASAARYVLTSFSTLPSSPSRIAAGTSLTLAIRASAYRGATLSRNFQLRVTAADVKVKAPGVTSGAGITGNVFTITGTPAEGSIVAYKLLPQVTILNPSENKVLSGAFRLQVHIWSPTLNGTSDLASYVYTTDGTAPDCSGTTKNLAASGNYTLGGRAAIFEAQITVPQAQQGPTVVRVCARTTGSADAGTTEARPVNVVVKAEGSGDGNLLVRDNSDQLCLDCHNLRTHSSQTTSRKYGVWSVNCRDCHDAHGTPNTFLMRAQITPPGANGPQAPRTVNFKKRTGDSGVTHDANPSKTSYINADGTGPCQTCHTRTSSPWNGAVARYRNDSAGGNTDKHHTQDANTQQCTNCHMHKNGFSPESRGGDTCDKCHTKIWTNMSSGVVDPPGTSTLPPGIASRHPISSLPSDGGSPIDSGIAWNGGPLKTLRPPSQRACMNMCHPDKRHNQPGGWEHSYNVFADATTAAARTVGRGQDGEITSGNVSNTDFDATQAKGGLCTSCHENATAAGGYQISKATFQDTAHDYAEDPLWGSWNYTMRDQSKFRRNCTKCHSDRADKQPSDDTYPFGAVHFSEYPRLLAGQVNAGLPGPNGQPGKYVFICYNCHGNGTVGQNRSNDVASLMGEFYAHPNDEDQHHLPGDAEFTAAAWGNQLGHNDMSKRHANCLDCHAVHTTKRGGHTYTAGTVTVNGTGNKTVTGVGTRWSSFYVGARIGFGSKAAAGTGGNWYTISAVNSPTSLTLSTGPSSSQPAGTAYRIERLTNLAGPTVDGAWGVVPNWTLIPAGETAAAGDFVSDGITTNGKRKLRTNVDLEAYLCFKCHSTYFWGTNTPPPSASGFSYADGTARFTNNSTTVTGSGTDWYDTTSAKNSTQNRYAGSLIQNTADGTWYKIASVTNDTTIVLDRPYTGTTTGLESYLIQMVHTDQIQEFNPNNAGYHPVVAGYTTATGRATNRSNGPTNNILTPWTTTSLMTCSDCHEADAPNDPNGPHGSAYKFMLKGPYRIWDETVSFENKNDGIFCMNCHSSTFSSSRFPGHTDSNHDGMPCFNCHVAIPHGSSSPGLLINKNGSGFSDNYGPYDQSTSSTRYNRNGNKGKLYIMSGPPTGTTTWAKSDCGCGGSSH
jgi:hypothetical protein